MEITNFCGEAIGDVKRVAPAGAPPIWKTFAAIGTKRRDAFPKLAGVLRDALTDLFGPIHIDKFSVSAVSDAVGEPARDHCPVATAQASLSPSSGVTPRKISIQTMAGQRNACSHWVTRSDFSSSDGLRSANSYSPAGQLSARIECVPRPANANR